MWESTAPPSVPARPACSLLGTSTCVGKGTDVCNLNSYSQNQMPLFCSSGVISTNVKWWLLSLIYFAHRNLMDLDTNVKLELVWKEPGKEIWGLTYLPIGFTGLSLSLSQKRRSKCLSLQLFCLKDLVIKCLWKMLSDSRGKKSKLMASKPHACILWTARKLS